MISEGDHAVIVSYRKNAHISAAVFFCFWLIILYAGADHPPPPGFILIVILDLACASLVYYRVPTYIRWQIDGRANRQFYALLEGLIVGAIIALLMMIIPGGGEPGITLSTVDRAIWIAVVGSVGAANAIVIYYANALVVKRQG